MGNKANKVIRGSRKKAARELTLRRMIQKKQDPQLRHFDVVAEHNYNNNSYNIESGDNIFAFENEISETEDENDDSSIEKHHLERPNTDSEDFTKGSGLKLLLGRRIVDIAYLFAQISNLNSHSNGTTICNFSNMKLLKETKVGLKSIFHFECTVCGCEKTITSTEETNESLDMNYALVVASYAVGIGCYQSEEFLANLDVPFMAPSTYDKHQKDLQKDLKKCAKTEMEKAIEEEKAIAIESNSVDINNTPLLDAAADGCWHKRSFGANFSSKSGTATLIGLKTKKVLWNGVKNEYCKKCANNKIRNVEEDHVCNTNYHGPPTGMETKLLVEAFQESEKLHGIRFQNLIADGDAKTFSAITDSMIYMNPPLKVNKRECVVHLYRSGRSRLFKVKNLLPAKAKEIIHGFQCARKHWAEADIPFHEKVEKLRTNLTYIPHHVFGDHASCDSYFCNKRKKGDSNLIPEIQKSGQLTSINNALTRLIDNTKSLLYNQNTNLVEQFNSIINKHTAGKRLNLVMAGSWEGRVNASTIDFNTHRLGSTILKYKKNISESQLMLKCIYKLETKRLNLNLNRNVSPRHKKSVYSPDEYYGTDTADQADLDEDAIEWRKTMYLRDIKFWQEDRANIEERTVGDSDCDLWVQINSYTVNAAAFGRIANARTDGGYKEIVQNIVTDKRFDNLAQVRHDQNHKKDAIKDLEICMPVKVNKCGTFIDENYAYMSASPAGVIDKDGIVVVSCPLTAESMTVEQGILKGLIKYWSVTKKPRSKIKKNLPFNPEIIGFNKKNQAYYQIQGMLHITQRQYAVFVAWTSKNIKTEIIQREDSFWTAELEPVISSFFENYFLPKILRSNR